MKGKTIVLGVTGSIAAYKAADLASKYTQAGARVNVIMTKSAVEFITPLAFRTITARPVATSMFDIASEYSVEHVALAEAADIVVIAPATANVIAKIAAGIADDMLSCTVLATKAPVLIAPAMNVNMWENEVTQHNVEKVVERGMTIVGPGYGRLASGILGKGRLVDLEEIFAATCKILGEKGDLVGKHIVITAGGTQEPIDPVRCVTNRSSGKMGYAIAEAARDRGAKVTLISAPTALPKPYAIEFIDCNTAQEMFEAVQKATTKADVLIMAAAVADYKPAKVADQKIKRKADTMRLEMERTVDILAGVKGKFLKVGFAAESTDLVTNAKDKLQRKALDLIVANNIMAEGCGFGSDSNKVVMIDRKGNMEETPLLSKREVADKILDKVVSLLIS